jgi:hypothetical protein
MSPEDAEWVKLCARRGHQMVVNWLATEASPATRAYCTSHWPWVQQVLVDALTRRVMVAFAERDAEVAKAKGQLQ